MLHKLPPDILLRILTSSERSPCDPSTIRTGDTLQLAFALSQLSSVLRHFVLQTYLNETVRHVNFNNSSTQFLNLNTFRTIASAQNLKSFSSNYAHLPLCESGENGDVCIAPLLRHQTLDTLLLRGLSGVTDFFMLGSALPRLTRLDLTYCNAVASNVMAALASIDSLEFIGLCGCTNVDDEGMRRFLSKGTARLNVHTFNVAYLPLSDAMLADMIRLCPSLKTLSLAVASGNLWSTGSYSEAGINRIKEDYPHVKVEFIV